MSKLFTIRRVAQLCITVYDEYQQGAEMDAGFDAGEFSGPASARAADNEVESIALHFGYTLEQITEEINKIYHEGEERWWEETQLRQNL